MQNNNQNNQRILQSKLDELDHLPGEEPISFEASWQKLELRMAPVQKRTRTYLYRVAAACLLAGLLLPWVLNDQKPVGIELVRNVSTIPALPAMNPVASHSGKTEIPVQTKKTTVHPPAKTPAVLQKQHAEKPQQLLVIQPVPVQEVTPAPAVEIPAGVTAVVVKKPMGIVHLNDLNNNTGSQPEQTAGNENKKMIRLIKRTGVESSLGDSPDQRTSGNHILFKNIN